MASQNVSRRGWYGQILRARVTRIIKGVGEDVLIALALLGGLSIIHVTLTWIDASEAFKQYFSALHEWTVACTYTVVGLKGIMRIIRA
jgi:hypothetical protein